MEMETEATEIPPTEVPETQTVKFTAEQEALIAAMIQNAVKEKELEQAKSLELKKAEQDGDYQKQLEIEKKRAEELEAKLGEVKRNELLSEVALELKLPKDLVPRLRGETKADLIADGKALLKHLKPAEAPSFEVPKTQTGASTGFNPEELYNSMKRSGKYAL